KDEKILGIIGSFLLLIGFLITMYEFLNIGFTATDTGEIIGIHALYFYTGFGIFITGQIFFGLVLYSIFKKTDNKSFISNYTLYAILWGIGLLLPTIMLFYLPTLNFVTEAFFYAWLIISIIVFIILVVAAWYYYQNLEGLSRLTDVGNFKNSGLLWIVGISLIFILFLIETFIYSMTGTELPMDFIGMIFGTIALILQIISCSLIPKELIKIKIFIR
ncbi:MAG: hypothetical protein MUO82_08695, partial [Candidatus Thermoplasmatota archaeon]|nr:hypothetical protein [Candidatus Thermoplasmatota archaeon]